MFTIVAKNEGPRGVMTRVQNSVRQTFDWEAEIKEHIYTVIRTWYIFKGTCYYILVIYWGIVYNILTSHLIYCNEGNTFPIVRSDLKSTAGLTVTADFLWSLAKILTNCWLTITLLLVFPFYIKLIYPCVLLTGEAALRSEPRMQPLPMPTALTNHRTGPPPISPSKRKYSMDQGDDELDCENDHVSKMSRMFSPHL